MKKPLNIIILGVQASGKGTQAKMLAEKFDLAIFETGQLLRDEVAQKGKFTARLQKTMGAGELAPNDIVYAVLKDKIKQLPADRGFILDGTPRNAAQIIPLEKMFEEAGRDDFVVLEVKISDREALERLSKRFVCSKCGELHIGQGLGRCKKCGGKLVRRKDDTPEIIKKRLAWSHEKTGPVIAEYKKRGRLIEINGEQPVEKVHEDIMQALRGKL